MTYRNLLDTITPRYGLGEGKAVLRVLLEDAFGISWTDALAGATEALSSDDEQRLRQMIHRIAEGEPVQYVVGQAEFCGRKFCVRRGVLIPRPETEMLVEALQTEELPEDACVLDIGTGSGCIAISVALEHPEWCVKAWDVSPTALAVARENAERLGAKVAFRKENVFSAARARRLGNPNYRAFDCIVSNPPYISLNERAEMENHVLDHEPVLALFVMGNDALIFYRAIIDLAEHALRPNGLLLFEVNRAYANNVAHLMLASGFEDVKVKQDIFGNNRMVSGRKKPELKK